LVPSNVVIGRFSPPALLQDNEGGENPFGHCPSIEQHAQETEGFSFGDLSADRTGVRFAEVATASKLSARKVQDALSTAVTESQFFPSNLGLPRRP
jgi:hypothetical protein